MLKLYKLLPFAPALLFAIGALSGCSSQKSEKRVLRVLNCEDYIYECEQEGYWCSACGEEGMYVPDSEVEIQVIGGEEIPIHKVCGTEVSYDMDMMDQFVEFWAATHDGEEIDYVYDTFDTNETMFNELKTGKTYYDVIVPSDYMIQKLLSNNMLEKFDDEKIDDLWANISPYLQNKFKGIKAENDISIYDYSVPYMWGTVGMMYNPNYYVDKKGQDADYIHNLFMDWDSLYGEDLKGTFSIKDSVRDTYAVSLIHAYNEEIAAIDNNKDLTAAFNKHDDETLKRVKDDMLKLKENAFGFECDSGKTDMTTQKIGANMCWSGDATWAITEARDNNLELYYSIPTSYNDEEQKGASNVWFDGFCMPKSDRLDKELAQAFIEFMSDSVNAAQNCDCVGYTPGVAGDAMLDYMYSCYDVRGEVGGEIEPEWIEDEDYIKYDLSYFFDGSLDEYAGIGDATVLYADPDYVGRELTAQYPEASDLDRLAIMNDFGTEGNAKLLDMWEQVRTNPLPTWAIILFAIEGVAAIAVGFYFLNKKIIRKKLKKARI